MGEGGEPEVSAREALRSLVSAARVWLELHRDAGTFGLPSASEFPAREGDRRAPAEAEPPGPSPLGALVAFAPHAAGDLPPDAPAPAPADIYPFTPAAPAATPRAPAVGAAAASDAPPAHESGEVPTFATPPPAPAHPSVRQVSVAQAAPQAALFSLGIDGGPLRPGTPLGVETPNEPEAKLVRLQVLAGQAAGCTRCGLHAGRTKSVFARGNPRARVMFIGEGPGADEDAQGLPFVGKSGQLLDRMIAAMGLGQDEIYIANVVKCRPPQNRKPEPDEMSACVPYLAEQIALIEPEVLVALGGTAVEGLLGGRVAITRARGQWRVYRATIPLMPTYHPAYLLRNPPAKREVWDDLRAVLQRLGRPVPGRGA